MYNHEEFIGKVVLSSNFGVGRVVGIDDLGMGDKQFLVIECDGKNVKNYIPVDDTKTYRFITSEKEIKKMLGSLSKDEKAQDFDSKKDRINYFKTQSNIQDINVMTDVIKELSSLEDRGSAEDLVYHKLLDSFALEHSIIMDMKLDESKKIVLDQLDGLS